MAWVTGRQDNLFNVKWPEKGDIMEKTIHRGIDKMLPVETLSTENFQAVIPSAPPAPDTVAVAHHPISCKSFLASLIINLIQFFFGSLIIIYGISIIQHTNHSERAFASCMLEKERSYFSFFIKCEQPSTYYKVFSNKFIFI